MNDDDESPKSKRGRLRTREARPELAIEKKFNVRFWEDADSRFGVMRKMRKAYDELRADADGDASKQRSILCKRASFLAIVLETIEADAASTGRFDLSAYTQSLNALTGCLKTLGIERRIKQIGGLQVYLDSKKDKAA